MVWCSVVEKEVRSVATGSFDGFVENGVTGFLVGPGFVIPDASGFPQTGSIVFCA